MKTSSHHLPTGIVESTNPPLARLLTSPAPAAAPSRFALAALAVVLAAVAPVAAQSPEVVVGPNLRVGPGQYNEPWIAASPENPDFLIAVTQTGGMSFRDPTAAAGLSTRSNAAFLSRNGGVSWEPVTLPGGETGSFDPMVVPGPDGRMWILYCYIGANTLGGILPDQPARSNGTIMVWSTDDEGATWAGPARLRSPVPPDHARIAADWSDGPHRGRLYVVWNDVRDSFIRDDFQLFLHTLDDGGKTVSEPKLLATIPGANSSPPSRSSSPTVRCSSPSTSISSRSATRRTARCRSLPCGPRTVARPSRMWRSPSGSAITRGPTPRPR